MICHPVFSRQLSLSLYEYLADENSPFTSPHALQLGLGRLGVPLLVPLGGVHVVVLHRGLCKKTTGLCGKSNGSQDLKQGLKVIYKICLHLGTGWLMSWRTWVWLTDLCCSTLCLVLPGQMEIGQMRLSRWGQDGGTSQIKVNPGSPGDGLPCILKET